MGRNKPPPLFFSSRRFAVGSAASAAVLAACGSAPGTTTGGASAPATTGNAIELSHWYHQYGEEGTQQAAIRYAEEYSKIKPNVKVTVEWTPGDYGAKLNAALLTPEGPDVFEFSGPILDLVNAGQVADLTDIYGDARSDFNEIGLQANTVGDRLYGVKMIDDMGLLYYRKSLLEPAGIAPPTTLDELGAAIQALNTGQTKGFFMGNDGGVGVMGDMLLWSSGHEYLKDNKPDFNSDATVAAFKKGQEFLAANSGAILSGAPTDWWDPSAFTQNLTAMQWTGLWAMPGIRDAIGDDFGVMPWPAIGAGEGRPATFWGGWSQYANAKRPNVEAAKEYIKWLWIDNTDIQKDWSLAYGFHVPPRKSAAASAEPLKTGPAAEAVTILNQYGRPLFPNWTGAMGTAWGDAVNNILKNNADPKAELDAAAQKVQAELDKQA
ncbi:extracellular solute-binding protein [Candidatus Gracilibacteria bacterium]|nr:extracellular solute-binding protein [Candidatus Gracilibacteria bacterium]